MQGDTLAAYTPRDYAADGFTYDAELTTPAAPIVIPNDDTLVIRLYYARDVKRYAVEHYKQKRGRDIPAGRDGERHGPERTSRRATATYTPKDYAADGFTYDAELTTPAAPIVIPNDDSLVIRLYYARDVKGYAVEHYKQNADGTYPLAATESDTGLSGLQGALAAYTPKVYTDGFTYDAELTTPAAPIVIPNDDSLVIKLYYARDVKRYAVEHYKQNADGTYPLDATESDTGLSGLQGALAAYTPRNYAADGFTYNAELTTPAAPIVIPNDDTPGDQALLRAGREELCGGALQAERGRDVPAGRDGERHGPERTSRRDTATYTPKKLRGGRVHVRRGTDDAGRADRDSERRHAGDQALLRAGT